MSGTLSRWLGALGAAVLGGAFCFVAISRGLDAPSHTPPASPKAPVYPAPDVSVTVEPVNAGGIVQGPSTTDGIIRGSARRTRRRRQSTKPVTGDTEIRIIPPVEKAPAENEGDTKPPPDDPAFDG